MAPNTRSPYENRSASERAKGGRLRGRGACTLTAEVAGQIESLVHNRLAGRVRDFRVVDRAEGLVLRGRARTYYAKQLAQHAVMEAGFAVLANEIEVS